MRQHAHNPVFWYPWGTEALDRAKAENKPILLSIGYSTCYWCHVMERDVFENPSIAALMNRCFINIKVDREEHPAIDEIYMVARQLISREGGWPNNVFLTPDLKPFYAGGTYFAQDSAGRPAWPRLLELMNYRWVTEQEATRKQADEVYALMHQFLRYDAPAKPDKSDVSAKADALYALLKEHHDEMSGGFFRAPKFPHECYLEFLGSYYAWKGTQEAFDILMRTLGKMAAGGIYDQVGCGFHRYAVDKEWYVPHFEKMLYNQAQLARLYTETARLSGNPYFADIARGVLDFVSGPFTDASGAFYSGFDAETDEVEGAYYAWSAEELDKVLSEEEVRFLTHFYALADIPHYPGHKPVQGQALVVRKPLDQAALERNMPYVQLAAMAGKVMNKLLLVRNRRTSPRLDDKIIVAWNGLMIDAFAHAGIIFDHAPYIERARKAADFLLEAAIDNEGELKRIYASGKAQLNATLEDYAFLMRGLLTLHRATSERTYLEAAQSLAVRVEEGFADPEAAGYFFTRADERLLLRVKNGDDSAVPNANAMMAHNFIDLFELTRHAVWRDKAQVLTGYFLDGNERILAEFATMMQAAMRLEFLASPRVQRREWRTQMKENYQPQENDAVKVYASVNGNTLTVTLDMKEGWHVNAHDTSIDYVMPTSVHAEGEGVEVLEWHYPEAVHVPGAKEKETLPVYEGKAVMTARLKLPEKKKRPEIKVMVRFQPCHGTHCHAVRDVDLKI